MPQSEGYRSPAPVESPVRGAGALSRLTVGLMLAGALCLVLAGAHLPALSITHVWFVESEYSLIDGIRGFFHDGQTALGLLVLGVTLVFPVTKILLGAVLLQRMRPGAARPHRLIGALNALARWSLTDVFILAVVILVINAQLISSADLRIGAFIFASGIVLSSAAFEMLRAAAGRR